MYGVRKWERGPGEGREQYRGDGGLILQGLKGLTKDFHLYFKRDDGKVLIWEIIRPYLIANGIRMSSKETSLNINTYIHNVANISKIRVENRRWLKAMAPHSGTLAWKIPWTEGPGGLQSMGSRGVRHNWVSSLSLSCLGERNGNPLQCSCLENPRDSGAWWATVYGVAQSQTRLKRLSSSSSSICQPQTPNSSSLLPSIH